MSLTVLLIIIITVVSGIITHNHDQQTKKSTQEAIEDRWRIELFDDGKELYSAEETGDNVVYRYYVMEFDDNVLDWMCYFTDGSEESAKEIEDRVKRISNIDNSKTTDFSDGSYIYLSRHSKNNPSDIYLFCSNRYKNRLYIIETDYHIKPGMK